MPDANRVRVDPLGRPEDGITHVVVRFGYAETTDVPAALATLSPEQTEGHVDV